MEKTSINLQNSKESLQDSDFELTCKEQQNIINMLNSPDIESQILGLSMIITSKRPGVNINIKTAHQGVIPFYKYVRCIPDMLIIGTTNFNKGTIRYDLDLDPLFHAFITDNFNEILNLKNYLH